MSDVGKFRVRKGWFGQSILQVCVDSPAFIGGRLDSNVRNKHWIDVKYENAPSLLVRGFVK